MMLTRFAGLVVALTLLVILLNYYDQLSIIPVSQAFTSIRRASTHIRSDHRTDGFGTVAESLEQQIEGLMHKSDTDALDSGEENMEDSFQKLEEPIETPEESQEEVSPDSAVPSTTESTSSVTDTEDEKSLMQQIGESGAVDAPVKTEVSQDSVSSVESDSVSDDSDLKGLAFPADSSCFVADYSKAEALLRMNTKLSTPILNLGMPKCGSSTLTEFFQCAGMRASHWRTDRHGFIGLCMRDAIQNGKPPIASCDSWFVDHEKSKKPPDATKDRGAKAILQMDVENNPDECIFPQMSYLQELHDEAPNATFVMNFRDVIDWASSVSRWTKKGEYMSDRLAACDLPGLPVGKGTSSVDLSAWLCGHVNNVRKFVEDHPSHALIELDLYSTEKNAEIMSQLFHTDKSCWGHANANPGRLRRLRAQGVDDDDEVPFQIWS